MSENYADIKSYCWYWRKPIFKRHSDCRYLRESLMFSLTFLEIQNVFGNPGNFLVSLIFSVNPDIFKISSRASWCHPENWNPEIRDSVHLYKVSVSFSILMGLHFSPDHTSFHSQCSLSNVLTYLSLIRSLFYHAIYKTLRPYHITLITRTPIITI